MSSFLHPAFLWGLAGLAIPIAIHLLSRKEGKIIKVGSLRHLRTSESPTFKSVKLNELLLLAVRCLLLAVMVLFISEMIFPTWWKSENKKWVLVDPVVANTPMLLPVLDSLAAQGYELRSLESGFPEMADASLTFENDYWLLVNELKKQSGTEVIVFSSNQFSGFVGKRKSLPENVKWISVDLSENEFLVSGTRIEANQVLLTQGNSNASRTQFQFVEQSVMPSDQYAWFGKDSVLISVPDTLTIAVISDDRYAYDREIMRAALSAINNSSSVALRIKTDLQQTADWVVWFSDEPLPEVSSHVIFFKEDLYAPLLQRQSKDTWQLSKRLNQEVASNQQLTTALYQLLIPTTNRERIANNDRRVLPEKLLWSTFEDNTALQSVALPNHQQVLFIIILLLFFAERVLAYSKRL